MQRNIICPQCGAMSPAGVEVCDECGYLLKQESQKDILTQVLLDKLDQVEHSIRRMYFDDEEEIREINFDEYCTEHMYLEKQFEHVRALVEIITKTIV